MTTFPPSQLGHIGLHEHGNHLYPCGPPPVPAALVQVLGDVGYRHNYVLLNRVHGHLYGPVLAILLHADPFLRWCSWWISENGTMYPAWISSMATLRICLSQ